MKSQLVKDLLSNLGDRSTRRWRRVLKEEAELSIESPKGLTIPVEWPYYWDYEY
jgi:hypothetical protein